jgi:long-chain fatty acid transport protein
MERQGSIDIRLKLFAVVLALGLALLVSSVAEATNGYLIHGIGTRAKALAGAGVALPQDALAAGTNPAGMAFVGKRYDVGLGLFNPNREYTISGNPSGFPGTFGLVPGTVESDSNYFFVPNFGANWQLANSTLGLAIYGQGGMNTDYPTATFHGSSPTGVDFSQLFIILNWAAKTASGRHAIGIAPILAVQQFEIMGVEAFAGFSAEPQNLTNKGHDRSTGFGGRVGYLGQWTDRFSVGFAYQFEIDMDEFDDYAGLFAGQGDFDIQETWVAGIAYKFSDSGAFMLDVQEIAYSDIANVGNPMFPNLLQAPLGALDGPGFGWEDMTIVKLGLQWGSHPWTWRLGFSTGDQPIPETEVLFNILAPGVMEEHITLGFSRRTQKGEINFALMHAPSVSVTGPNPLEAPGQQQIELEMDQWDLELGYSWGF